MKTRDIRTVKETVKLNGTLTLKPGTRVTVIGRQRGNGDWMQRANPKSPIFYVIRTEDGHEGSVPLAALDSASA